MTGGSERSRRKDRQRGREREVRLSSDVRSSQRVVRRRVEQRLGRGWASAMMHGGLSMYGVWGIFLYGVLRSLRYL